MILYKILVLLIPLLQSTIPITLRTCCNFESEFINNSCNPRVLDILPEKFNWTYPTFIGNVSNLNSELQSSEISLRTRRKDFSCLEQQQTPNNFKLKLAYDSSLAFRDNARALFPNGYLQVDTFYLPPTHFCINRLSGDRTVLDVISCTNACKKENRCLPKCCPWGMVTRWSHPERCSIPKAPFNSNLLPENWMYESHVPFYRQKLDCIRRGRMISTTKINIFNSTDMEAALDVISADQYCVDDVVTSFDLSFNWKSDQAIFYCGQEWPLEEFALTKAEKTAYGTCFVISSVFLLGAILAYCIKLHRISSNIHTWMELFYMIFLLFFGIFFSLLAYLPENQNNDCTLYNFIAKLGYSLFAVSLFSWSTLLSFDIFMAFRKLRPVGFDIHEETNRLLPYCIAGFSFPLIVTASTYGYSYFYWWEDTGYCLPIQFAAIRTVQGMLLLVNLFFFIWTFGIILKTRQKVKFARGHCPRAFNEQISCFMKLFIISGITYGGIIVSYLYGTERQTSWYLVLFRMFLNLRGLTVFLVYVCNKQMKDLLILRYREGLFCGCNLCNREQKRDVITLSRKSTFQSTKPTQVRSV